MRVLRSLLITLAVLCVLFVAVDRIAVEVVEAEAASRVRDAQGFTAEPEISIKGFPFLTQVAAGELETVRASAEGVQAGSGEASLRVDRFTADLRGVRLTDNYRSAVAESASGTALISYADLSEAAPQGVSVSYAGKDKATGAGEVKVTFRISFLGQTFERSVISQVSLKDETVSLRAKSIPGVNIPGFEEFVRKQIDFSERVTGLPTGISLDRLSAGPDGVTATLTGTDVSLSG